MQLHSPDFPDQAHISPEFAFCKRHPERRVELSLNRNPALHWDEPPQGTRSFVLICCDPDAPADRSDANIEGRRIIESAPRADFYHWVLVDVPGNCRAIEAGMFSDRVTPHGKKGPQAPLGCRQGVNSYTAWFAGETDMAGDYYGYDGPCPPWNDERAHRYVFTLYALSAPHAPVAGRFTGPDVKNAIAGNTIAQSSVTGLYTLNPRLIRA